MEEARVKGNGCFKAGNLAQAIIEYQGAIDAYHALPNKEDRSAVANIDEVSKSLGNQIMCLHKLGEFEKCINAAAKAIAINPFLAKVYGFNGMSMLDTNPNDEILLKNPKIVYSAHLSLSRGIALLPDLQQNLGAHLNRARLLLADIHQGKRNGSATDDDEKQQSSEVDPTATVVQSSAAGGRGVFAGTRLYPGAVVARMKNPFSVALYDKTLSTSLCFNCGKVAPEQKFIECTKCKSVAYCSETCAAVYAMRHALECDKFIKLNEIVIGCTNREIDIPEDFEEIAAHVITTISGIKMELPGYKMVQELEGHDDAVVQSLSPMAPMMWELYDTEPHPFVSHIIGVVRSNSLQLSDASGFAAGEGLFAENNICMFNHSCSPNCIIDTVTGTIGPIRVIEEGDELSISYIPQMFWPSKLRKEGLAERFFFTCKCERCRTEDSFEKVTTATIAGARPSATNYFHPLVQNVCGSIRSRHVEDIDDGAMQELQELTEKVSKELHPLHYLLHDLRNTMNFVKSVLQKKSEVFSLCMSELCLWECIVPGALSVKCDKLNNALLCCDEEDDVEAGKTKNDSGEGVEGPGEVTKRLVAPKDVEYALGGSYFGSNALQYASIYKY